MYKGNFIPIRDPASPFKPPRAAKAPKLISTRPFTIAIHGAMGAGKSHVCQAFMDDPAVEVRLEPIHRYGTLLTESSQQPLDSHLLHHLQSNIK